MSLATDLYESLGPFADDDISGELSDFVAALVDPAEPVYAIVGESDTHVSWEVALDVDEAPSEALPWLAQWVGVEQVRGETDAQLRDRIRNPDGMARGSLSSLVEVIERTLTGSKRVVVREQNPGPYNLYVRTRTSETPDPGATEAAVLSQKPASLVLDYAAVSGLSYIDLAAENTDYDAVAAAYDTYADIEEAEL